MKTYSVYVDGILKSEHEDFVDAFYTAYDYSCSSNHKDDDIIISFKSSFLTHRFKFGDLMYIDKIQIGT